MRILKHGKVNRVITCICGCEFEYDPNDIQYDIRYGFNDISTAGTAYVICPECGAKIFLQLPIQSQKIEITY